MGCKKLESERISVFDLDAEYSSSEIENLMKKLRQARQKAKQREKEEAARKEREAAERKAAEENEKAEAHIREVTSMDLPLDWSNVFDTDERAGGVHAESIPDGLVLSLNRLGRVDIEYISKITGADCKTVICALKGSIYQNPLTWNECFYKGWETAEEYLSGNLMRKHKAAKEADRKYCGYFAGNVSAIEKVLPPAVATDDIYITLGSPWVPADIIDDFILYLFGELPHDWQRRETYMIEARKTRHDPITGTWEIPDKGRYYGTVSVRETYGTAKMEALYILENTLNMKTVSVLDTVSCTTNKSGVKRVINKDETVAAVEKQKKLIKAFRDWVWTDESRRIRLETIYENNYGCVRRRIFDGSFLDFPSMSPSVSLYPYQKDAVARIIFTPNTLLAHDVGAGKTYVMIAAGQEMKRMGLSSKNMYVVPNNIVEQWKDISLSLYPGAKLLCVSPKTFRPDRRGDILARIRDEDFDGIIIAYSCFEMIPLSTEYLIEEAAALKAEISEVMNRKGGATNALRKKKEKINKKITELKAAADDTGGLVCFDELGITRLFVDEAHNFKNVPFDTRMAGVPGISCTGSRKCRDMMDKVHMVQKKNDGKGVVFATGTPVTNSITDAFIMQSYLQSGELAMLDLRSFDSWVGMFAEKSTEFEIDVDTSSYRLSTRFARFHNLPELTSLLSSIADFHGADGASAIPEHDGYLDSLVTKTPDFEKYLKNISKRADYVRRGVVGRREDNMLKITTDGRKAALDMRLVDSGCGFTCQSKVERCAENVADIYFRTAKTCSTQLVFCDTSTPKEGFNIYDELRDRLEILGVPRSQVAFIHDAGTDAKRESLFADVRAGNIRVLVGSTFRLGLGVNIQDKLIALHHIDVPWRPADMTQREGRILRQGNENSTVSIYRYITEGSFDAYSWQLLETKQRFISQLLSGSVTERSGADIDDTVLNYAEVKALAVGNPLVKQRVEASNEYTRYLTLQRKAVEARQRLEREKSELPGKISYQREIIRRCRDDSAFIRKWYEEHPPVPEDDRKLKAEKENERREIRQYIYDELGNHILEKDEKRIMEYCGFDIVLPSNMTKENLHVWLKRSGKYYVPLADKELGVLVRIDNCLKTMDTHLAKLESRLAEYGRRQAEIESDLSRDETYSDQIMECRKRIAELDRKLGVRFDE